jgi:hypothetical protein
MYKFIQVYKLKSMQCFIQIKCYITSLDVALTWFWTLRTANPLSILSDLNILKSIFESIIQFCRTFLLFWKDTHCARAGGS